MEKLSISKANALQAYKNTDNDGRKLLSNLFGDQLKLSEKITDRVSTFEDVCAEAGVDPRVFESYQLASDEERYINNFRKLLLIVKVLNEGWEPDFTNSDQYKYYPWFQFVAGSGFSYDVCDCTNSYTGVGARLCFKTKTLAEYAGKQFADIYNQHLSL